ncbi:hypothetical protein ACTXT7_004045 [Hymenolepis weldensis]
MKKSFIATVPVSNAFSPNTYSASARSFLYSKIPTITVVSLFELCSVFAEHLLSICPKLPSKILMCTDLNVSNFGRWYFNLLEQNAMYLCAGGAVANMRICEAISNRPKTH